MNAPEQFMQNMQTLLQEDYQAYAASFSMPSFRGLRLNTLRKNVRKQCEGLSFIDEKIPYVENGYYIKGDSQPAKHPYYAAGLYYLQEPSAMLPADRLPVDPGDLVLDLCAAPGGKSTALLAKLNGTGMLLANDISASRAKVLLKNLILTGADNFFVSAMDPKNLATLYGPVFDKILVDAPCSGEGMFRHDPSLMREWTKKGPSAYVEVQREILQAAVSMLKPGGLLLYSTCTFSMSENEENILWLMEQHPNLKPVQIPKSDGMREGFCGLDAAARCFPHLMKGEGHFLALLQKAESKTEPVFATETFSNDRIPQELFNRLDTVQRLIDHDRIHMQDHHVFYLPVGYEKLYRKNIRFLRTGLLIGEWNEKGTLKPDQALAMWLSASEYANACNLSAEDERVLRYLRGETIFTTHADYGLSDGDVLICVDGYALGFAKLQNGRLKNGLHIGFVQH